MKQGPNRKVPMKIEDRFWRWTRKLRSGCWEWQGALTANSFPAPVMRCGFTNINVRRWTVEHFTGRLLNANEVAKVSCGNDRCTNPEHADIKLRKDITRKDACKTIAVVHRDTILAWTGTAVGLSRRLRINEKYLRTVAKRLGKTFAPRVTISRENAEKLRTMPRKHGTLRAAAKKLGISYRYACTLRSGWVKRKTDR